MVRFNVASEFSPYPAGRYKTDGPFTGEALREKLVPLLREQEVHVELDNEVGYSSGFLEETFGGMIRECGMRASDLRAKLFFVSSDPTLTQEIWEFIDEAEARLAAAGPENLRKDPVRVEHSSLERVTSDSPFKSRCPTCKKGILLVARDQKSLRLLREDACISCGQRYVYTDTFIANHAPEPEKVKPS